MHLTEEQQQELARFPALLKALVAAELAAGNAILEISHSHPAPPVGACVLLAKQVSTRPRASGSGLSFYERNGSLYSGEFTDAARIYFLLEAPHPPPPEPDMEAIRQAREPTLNVLALLAQREPARTSVASLAGLDAPVKLKRIRGRQAKASGECTLEATPTQASLVAETTTGWTRLLRFSDPRPLPQVQFALERELMVLFTAAMDGGQFRLTASANVNGARYTFELRFVVARKRENIFTLRTEVSWADAAPEVHDYFRKTSDSWYRLWTRGLKAANPMGANDGSGAGCQQHCEAAIRAQRQLNSVAAVQRAIIEAMKQGGTFNTSHKEGGTILYWRNEMFFRTDYGDYPDSKMFADETEFLKMLRQFSHHEITRHAAQVPLSELDAWKLILRRLNPDAKPAGRF